MSRTIRTLLAATAAGGLALSGLLTAGGASASTSPGTTGQGSWSFDPGDGSNAIQLGGSHVDSRAQVLQPINADGSSVFNHKSATIPLQFTLQQDTVTTPSVWPGVLESDSSSYIPGSGGVPNPSPPAGSVPYGAVSDHLGGTFTLSDISSLVADYSWNSGTDSGGALRWSIRLSNGEHVFVYFGDAPNFTSETPGVNGSGVNLMASSDLRFDSSQLGGPIYGTLAQAETAAGGNTVTGISLVLDGGWTDQGTQKITLQDVNVNVGAESDVYTPGTVGTASDSGWVSTNAPTAYVSLYLASSSTPIAGIDETLASTQGDSGGVYRQVDGKYIYNFPVSNLPDKTASYNVGISLTPDSPSVPITNATNPVGLAHFGLK